MRVIVLYSFFSFLAVQGICQKFTQQSFLKTNSILDEQASVISPDGKTLFFTIANHPMNVAGKKDLGDIWISSLTGEEWSSPVHADVLNDAAYNAVLGFSDDGNQLFLAGHYSSKGKASTQGIAISRKTNSGWSTPENISIAYFLNRSPVLQGFVSKDGRTFVFSAESRESAGGEDLYVTFKDDLGNWREPRNLGPVINTRLQEFSPSLSEDGRILFFSSNGRRGYGSFDVYFAERLDDTWTNWSAPVNMGANINSEGRELFYRTYSSSGLALFTSTLNSDGYGDLRIYYPPKETRDSLTAPIINEAKDTVAIITDTQQTEVIVSNEKSVRLWGKIVNGKTSQLINAEIHYQSDSLRKELTASEGKYEIRLPLLKEYLVKVESPGFVGTMERLDVRSLEMKELEMNFKLQPVEVGATVNLKNVLFQQGTSNLLPESSDELDMVASFMNTNPKVFIELGGHTDNRGIHSHNVKLSKERVDKVKEYLLAKGIEANRITGKGYGGTRPIADNDAEDTRKLNRRVEFTIVRN